VGSGQRDEGAERKDGSERDGLWESENKSDKSQTGIKDHKEIRKKARKYSGLYYMPREHLIRPRDDLKKARRKKTKEGNGAKDKR